MFKSPIPLCVQDYLGEPEKLVTQWPLFRSPLCLFSTVGTYFCTLRLIHILMKNRKPFSLRKTLIVYNAFQVLYSAYICKEVFATAIQAGYNITCTPVNLTTESGVRMAKAFWLFYVSKLIDLADTIFFILRKKYNQVTFLHLYHHSSMVFNWYIGTLYSPGGQAFFSVGLNAFVHVVMYLYYMLSAFGPWMQKYLWWKRYLTQLQLTQFALVFIHLLVGLYNKCKAPFWLNCFTLVYLTTMLVLFGNFYYKAYKSKGVGKTVEKVDFGCGGNVQFLDNGQENSEVDFIGKVTFLENARKRADGDCRDRVKISENEKEKTGVDYREKNKCKDNLEADYRGSVTVLRNDKGKVEMDYRAGGDYKND